MKMVQDTTQGKQAMGYGDAHLDPRCNNGARVVRTEDKAKVGEGNTAEGEEDILVDETQGDHSTASTDWSHDKRVFSAHPSPILEAGTDPTSIPSGVLEDLDLERKGSIEAVHGSDSVHSDRSDSSTGYSETRQDAPIAVNPDKVEAIGGHFGEPDTETPRSRFHDPQNSREAQHINDKIKQANATMDDIDRYPAERFRDHGSSFQVSARPRGTAETALDTEGDITKRKVHFPPDHLLHIDIEEGYNVQRPRRRHSCCCIIM